MTTGTLILPISGATLPDGSASNSPAQFQRTKSTASAPVYHFIELLFDPATEESAYWSFRMPTDYASSPVLKLQWKANQASNAVVWGCQLAAITPTDADTPNEHALATTNTVTNNCNATEARRLVESSITLTNADSLAAGDFLAVRVYRVAANGSDTCTVDAELVAVSLEYTTT